MIDNPIAIGYVEEKPGKFTWAIPIPAKGCSLVGWRYYHSKKAAKKAALTAWRRCFDRGDMV